jgi:hypothetical protein
VPSVNRIRLSFLQTWAARFAFWQRRTGRRVQ